MNESKVFFFRKRKDSYESMFGSGRQSQRLLLLKQELFQAPLPLKITSPKVNAVRF